MIVLVLSSDSSTVTIPLWWSWLAIVNSVGAAFAYPWWISFPPSLGAASFGASGRSLARRPARGHYATEPTLHPYTYLVYASVFLRACLRSPHGTRHVMFEVRDIAGAMQGPIMATITIKPASHPKLGRDISGHSPSSIASGHPHPLITTPEAVYWLQLNQTIYQ